MGKAVVTKSNRVVQRKETTGRVGLRTQIPAASTGHAVVAKRGYEIRAVAKALDLLEAISEIEDNDAAVSEEVRVSQLSRQLGVNKTAIFRLLATFEGRGYVEREEKSGIYRIGMNAYEVGRKLLSRMNLLRQARPVMEDLCRRCNEAVYLAVRRGSDFLFIDLVESAQQVKVASLLGKRFSLMSGAPGQLMLAFSSQQNLASATTEQTFQFIRQQGYCADQGGLGDFVSCIAAPLFNAGGTVAGALCLVSPSYRMAEPQIEGSLLPDLKDASEAISAKLGYHNHHAGRVRL